jgi:hypothetical protein
LPVGANNHALERGLEDAVCEHQPVINVRLLDEELKEARAYRRADPIGVVSGCHVHHMARIELGPSKAKLHRAA